MKLGKKPRPAIANAIAWAAMMIATALVITDAPLEQKSFLLLLQIVGWFSVNLALGDNGRSPREELACVRKRLNPPS
jgi:hypothetical protein